MKLLILASLLLVACNQIYGLDETRVHDAFEQFLDKDQDGIADGKDNCVDDANANQADRDIDGIGDECDGCDACPPCAVAANHDEDGDHIADGCDSCPVDAGETIDSDGDGIGDLCEHGTALQHRVLFDGFETPSVEWLEEGARWEVANDVVTVKSGFDGTSDAFLLHRPTALVTGTEWYVEATIHMSAITPRAAGFFLRTKNGGDNNRLCHVGRLGPTSYTLSATDGFTTPFVGPADGIVRLRVAAIDTPTPAHRLICSIVGTLNAYTTAETGIGYPLHVVLYSGARDVSFDYVNIVSP